MVKSWSPLQQSPCHEEAAEARVLAQEGFAPLVVHESMTCEGTCVFRWEISDGYNFVKILSSGWGSQFSGPIRGYLSGIPFGRFFD